MESTRQNDLCPYIGADLTDLYAAVPRPIDVCGLKPQEHNLLATFWHWKWDPKDQGIELGPIEVEVRSARATMFDGPQGLATVGCSLRECERLARAAGKTPAERPPNGVPFGGYINSSLDLFLALHNAGIPVGLITLVGGVCEVYPGDIWQRLASRTLPRKNSPEGRLSRKHILEALGVIGLPERPTHDQYDACLSALMAAAADGRVPGITVCGIGLQTTVDGALLREGQMVVPEVNGEIRQKIASAIADIPVAVRRGERASPATLWPDVVERAEKLLCRFVHNAENGNAQICSYKCAYRYIFQRERWSQAYMQQVVSAARGTPKLEIRGLGMVRLDAFIVNAKTRLPGNGHWETAGYTQEEWERVLGTAELLKKCV